jgi:hypothetical protein
MVESCFGSSGEQLLIPGRVLVGEGVLTKMCRKRPKPRQFFLFNDILVYGNIVIGKKKYNKQHIIPLEEVQLQGLDDTPREFNVFDNELKFYFMNLMHFFRFSKWLVDSYNVKKFCCLCCDEYREAGMDGSHQQVH